MSSLLRLLTIGHKRISNQCVRTMVYHSSSNSSNTAKKPYLTLEAMNFTIQRKLHSFSEFNLSKLSKDFYEQKLTVEENLSLPLDNKYPSLRKFKILRSLSIYCNNNSSVCRSLSSDKRFKHLISDFSTWSGKLRNYERCDLLRFIDVFLKYEVIKEDQQIEEINMFIEILHRSIVKFGLKNFAVKDLLSCVLSLSRYSSILSQADPFISSCCSLIERKYKNEGLESENILNLVRILSIPSSLIADEIKEAAMKSLEDRVIKVKTMPKEFSIQNVKQLLIAFKENNIFHAQLFHRCIARYRGSLAYNHYTLKDNLEILELIITLSYSTDYQPYFALSIAEKVLKCNEMEQYFLTYLTYDSLISRDATEDELTLSKNVLARISLYMGLLGCYSANILNALESFNATNDNQNKRTLDEDLAILLHSYDGIRYVFLNDEEYSSILFYPWQMYLRFARGERLDSLNPSEVEDIINKYKAFKEPFVNEFLSAVNTLGLPMFWEAFVVKDGVLYDVVLRFSEETKNSSGEIGIYIETHPDTLVNKPYHMFLNSLNSALTEDSTVSVVHTFKWSNWRSLMKDSIKMEDYLVVFLLNVVESTSPEKKEEFLKSLFSDDSDKKDEPLSPEEIQKMNVKLLEYLEKGLFNIQIGFTPNLSMSDYQSIQDEIKKQTAPPTDKESKNQKFKSAFKKNMKSK